MLTLFSCLRDWIRGRAALQAEILALRHQLSVLKRSSRGQELRLGWADRDLLVRLSQLWDDWRSALLIVKPATVIAWHRKGFRLYWSWRSRCREGRPAVSPEVRNLIRQMSLANPKILIPLSSGINSQPNMGMPLPNAIWQLFTSLAKAFPKTITKLG
jgi:hypothetical protein